MTYCFDFRNRYSRRNVARLVGMSDLPNGGPWLTGYAQYGGSYFIFCAVGVPGRTGHDYENYFEEEDLVWSGKTGSRKNQPMIASMIDGGAEVHIFWRGNDRDDFSYVGLGRAVWVSDDVPVRVRWRFPRDQ